MFPSAALMPPWAATVWERVGKSLVMQAVLRPDSASPNAARRPAPPAPLCAGGRAFQRAGVSRSRARRRRGWMHSHDEGVILVLDEGVLSRDGGLRWAGVSSEVLAETRARARSLSGCRVAASIVKSWRDRRRGTTADLSRRRLATPAHTPRVARDSRGLPLP